MQEKESKENEEETKEKEISSVMKNNNLSKELLLAENSISSNFPILVFSGEINMNHNCLKKIVIEGNIGAGKTTILNSISSNFNKQFEPVEKFTILESFYKDPFKYANDLQIQVADVHLEVEKTHSIPTIFERTIETSINIFAKMALDDKMITSSQFEELEKKLNDSTPVSAFIYIDVDLDTCLERIKIRKRPGEENIQKIYLQKLKNKMDLLYDKYQSRGIPCLRIENMTGHLDEAIQMIEEFLAKLEFIN